MGWEKKDLEETYLYEVLLLGLVFAAEPAFRVEKASIGPEEVGAAVDHPGIDTELYLQRHEHSVSSLGSDIIPLRQNNGFRW